jgi:phospholipase/lecithinase/hemolysin
MEQPYERKEITNIVVFGDSVSDIGKMAGRTVSVLPGIVLNEYGRFSDGKNWVDFFWEGLGQTPLLLYTDPNGSKERSKAHLDISNFKPQQLNLAVYAEGGAIGWKDLQGLTDNSFAASKVLNTLDAQVEAYLLAARARASAGETLCIIWIGSNDIVTIRRSPEALEKVAENICAWGCELTRAGNHVLIIDVPDPQYMPRYAKDSDAQRQFAHGALVFNRALVQFTDKWKGMCKGMLDLFKLSERAVPLKMRHLNLAPIAQDSSYMRGEAIGEEAAEKIPLLRAKDIKVTGNSVHASTRDELHPTEVVYRFIGELVLACVLERNFTFKST